MSKRKIKRKAPTTQLPDATAKIGVCARRAKEAVYRSVLSLMEAPELMHLYESGARAQHMMQILAVFQPDWAKELSRQSAMAQLGEEQEMAFMRSLYKSSLKNLSRHVEQLGERLRTQEMPQRDLLVEIDKYTQQIVTLMGSGVLTKDGAVAAQKGMLAVLMFSSAETNAWISAWQDRESIGMPTYKEDIERAKASAAVELAEMQTLYADEMLIQAAARQAEKGISA